MCIVFDTDIGKHVDVVLVRCSQILSIGITRISLQVSVFFVALIVHVRMHACVCVCTRCRQKLIAAACMLFCLTAASWHVSAADTALLPSTMAHGQFTATIPYQFTYTSHLLFCSVYLIITDSLSGSFFCDC